MQATQNNLAACGYCGKPYHKDDPRAQGAYCSRECRMQCVEIHAPHEAKHIEFPDDDSHYALGDEGRGADAIHGHDEPPAEAAVLPGVEPHIAARVAGHLRDVFSLNADQFDCVRLRVSGKSFEEIGRARGTSLQSAAKSFTRAVTRVPLLRWMIPAELVAGPGAELPVDHNKRRSNRRSWRSAPGRLAQQQDDALRAAAQRMEGTPGGPGPSGTTEPVPGTATLCK